MKINSKSEKNILHEIAAKTKQRVEEQKKLVPLSQLKAQAEALPKGDFAFEKALAKDFKNGLSFICEVKKASPSKGVIAEEFPYVEIAKRYQSSGAAAVSVLTEPHWFKGHDDYLKEIASEVTIPLLRKDFTVDEYMLYQAKLLGAGAVLLICALLDDETLVRYIEISHSLGLSALVETHDAEEVQSALNAGARIIGVNNRDLTTFNVDITLSERLKKLVPSDKIFVAESGIKTKQDVDAMRKIGADAVLIGEALMRGEQLM